MAITILPKVVDGVAYCECNPAPPAECCLYPAGYPLAYGYTDLPVALDNIPDANTWSLIAASSVSAEIAIGGGSPPDGEVITVVLLYINEADPNFTFYIALATDNSHGIDTSSWFTVIYDVNNTEGWLERYRLLGSTGSDCLIITDLIEDQFADNYQLDFEDTEATPYSFILARVEGDLCSWIDTSGEGITMSYNSLTYKWEISITGGATKDDPQSSPAGTYTPGGGSSFTNIVVS